MNILQKYLKDSFSLFEVMLQRLGLSNNQSPLYIRNIQLSDKINDPLFRLLIFKIASVLRCHRNSSYATNMNFGFQLNGLSDGENRKSV